MKLSQIDLNLLVILDAIIKERSVTRAGRRVGLSQPAASGSLKRLRQLLSDPLIERVGSGSRLTPLAQALAQPLEQILQSIEEALQSNVTFVPEIAQRLFRIVASDYTALIVLPPLLAELRRVAPGVTLQVQRPDKDTPRVLTARQAELSIEPTMHKEHGLSRARLFEDHWVCAVWSGNRDVSDQITHEQFLNAGHVTYSIPPYGFTMADRCLGALARSLNIQMEADSFTLLPMLLRGTDLIGLVQARLAEQLAAAADIRVLEPPIALPELVFHMSWASQFDSDPGHLWLRERLLLVAGRLGAASPSVFGRPCATSRASSLGEPPTAEGECGLDSSAVGMGCKDLGDPTFRMLAPNLPAPRPCAAMVADPNAPDAGSGA